MPMYTLPGHPAPAPRNGRDRTYLGMREVAPAEPDDEDLVAQEALEHHRAAQAAIDGRRVSKAARREWLAAAVGLALLVIALGALLLAHSSDIWP